jgi:hypothetical protein
MPDPPGAAEDSLNLAMNYRRLVIPATLTAVALAVALAVAVPAGGPAALASTVQFPANVDFDNTGGYGAYGPTVLGDTYVQGVDINVDWSSVQIHPGTASSSFRWGPLDKTASAWAGRGKHLVLVVRAANETGGATVSGSTCARDADQFLPKWEITALGKDGTYCDSDLETIVPDWFSPTFQNDFRTFVRALGKHVSAESYYSSISYVRVGDGLGGEGFYLMPDNVGNSDCSPAHRAPPCQEDETADKAWIISHWHYSPLAWEHFQEQMLAAYDAAFPPPVQVIYSIARQDTIPGSTYQLDYDVVDWATTAGHTRYDNIGIGEQCLPPGGLTNDYADFSAIDSLIRHRNPNAYIQFQTCGVTTTAAQELGIIKAAEGYGARSIEWYERTFTRQGGTPSVKDMTAYQTWVNNTFGR